MILPLIPFTFAEFAHEISTCSISKRLDGRPMESPRSVVAGRRRGRPASVGLGAAGGQCHQLLLGDRLRLADVAARFSGLADCLCLFPPLAKSGDHPSAPRDAPRTAAQETVPSRFAASAPAAAPHAA